MQELDASAKELEAELHATLLELPNIVDDDAPVGSDEEANALCVRGTVGTYDFEVRDHVDLDEGLGLLDMEAAGRVAGARFTFLREASRGERALINFMLDMPPRT